MRAGDLRSWSFEEDPPFFMLIRQDEDGLWLCLVNGEVKRYGIDFIQSWTYAEQLQEEVSDADRKDRGGEIAGPETDP